jgi:hypothetical protein
MEAGRVDEPGGATNEEVILESCGFGVVAIMKGPANGGQGGKLGHSKMDHWVFTEEIKTASRKVRRLLAREEIAQERRRWEDDRIELTDSEKSNLIDTP